MARDLYLQGYSRKDISELIGVSGRTVYSWSQKHSWKVAKDEQTATASDIVQKLQGTIEKELQKDEPSADRLAKIGAVIEKFRDRNKRNLYLFDALKLIDTEVRTMARDATEAEKGKYLSALNIFVDAAERIKSR